MSFPSELIIFFVSMLPIVELRGAIPLALSVYHLSPLSAFFFSVLGNLIPVIFLLWWLEPISKFLSRHFVFFQKFFNWLFERTRRKHSRKFEIWGSLALVSFVAIPFPLTGGWTGAVAAFVFGIPFKKAFPLIALGIILAGLLVLFSTLGFISF